MTEQVFAKPKKGVNVPKPEGGFLAAEGENVPRCMFWLRRERDGDVTLSPPNTGAKKPPVKQPVKDV